jgi:hypothetical protein
LILLGILYLFDFKGFLAGHSGLTDIDRESHALPVQIPPGKQALRFMPAPAARSSD